MACKTEKHVLLIFVRVLTEDGPLGDCDVLHVTDASLLGILMQLSLTRVEEFRKFSTDKNKDM